MDEPENEGGGDFKQYIVEKDNYTTETFKKLSASDMRDFSDRLLAAIANSEVVLAKDEKPVESHTESDTSISFKLKMGGYLIKLSNGPSRIYQPIATYVKPKRDKDTGKYKLKAETVSGADTGDLDAKSMKITSTKTVNVNKGGAVKSDGRAAHGQIGDSFIFRVETPIPRYPTEAVNKDFAVQDQPTLGLTITTGSVKVWIGDKENAKKEELTSGEHYTREDIEAQSNNNRSTGFKVKFSEMQYQNKLADAGEQAKKLTIEYRGTLDNKAPVKGGAENHAHPLIPKNFYKSDAGHATVTPAITKIYTYGVKITKTGKAGKESSATTTGLQGAKFKLYKRGKSQTEIHVKEQQATGAGAGASTGKYIVQADSGGGATTAFTSGPDGLLQIDGLDAGTYILEEIKAPSGGYALLPKSIAIVIKDSDFDGKPDDDSTINGQAASVDSENRLTYNLTNKKADFRLPKTGAMGAVIFGVVGVTLIVISAVLVIVHRRKTKKAKRSS